LNALGTTGLPDGADGIADIIHIEWRVGTEDIQRSLKPLHPDRIEHDRGGCSRRKSIVNARKHLFPDLPQQGQEIITGIFLDRLNDWRSDPNRR
jgi:hypothetical protein